MVMSNPGQVSYYSEKIIADIENQILTPEWELIT